MQEIVKFLPTLLLHLLKTLTYGWLVELYNLIKLFIAAVKKLCKFLKDPHPKREEVGEDCTIVDNPSFHRPDPCIYSQDYLLKLGLAVTWDNPDIVVRKGGVIVPEDSLLPDTDYEIEATVWNNSYEAPAVGLRSAFSFLTFGVATIETAIGDAFVNLGVKGGVNHPAHAKINWRTPAVPGHYCLKVALNWFDDANPANNIGQNNLNVVAPQSPAQFTFRLRNAMDKTTAFRFETDAYTIPNFPACKTVIGADERGTFSERLRRIRQRHGRGSFPVPPGWAVEISPDAPSLLPNEETDISVKITPPAGFAGRQNFNVNALSGAGYVGGVTLVVAAD
jgi:hypothetical protein